MSPFITGHATHPDWRMALALAAAQVDAQLARQSASDAGPPTLGIVYFTDAFAPQARPLLQELRRRWPAVAWVGSVGVGVAASGVEYIDEPALVLMLASVPVGRFEVFSGARPLAHIDPFSALVHADPALHDLAELVAELSDRTASGYLFGGLASSRTGTVHVADGVWEGGLSGVAFTRDVPIVSRVTQGCQPVGPVRRITAAERNIVLALDGEPALPCLLRDLGLDRQVEPRAALPLLRGTMAAVTDAHETMVARGRQFGADARVRPLIGLDPGRAAVAIGEIVEAGMNLAFCRRDAAAARLDLVRICSEIREELDPELDRPMEPLAPEPQAEGPSGARARPAVAAAQAGAPGSPRQIKGAVYISCAGRGGPHFGGPSAELQIVRHALGDVPLVGFFAAGEIARHHVYGYTGVLTVFTSS
jgi:small ligand-binding sensory domain FIST